MAQQFSGLPMKDLIGGPLMAAAQANHKMAMTQVQFMLDTCFNKKSAQGDDAGKEGSLEPIMVTLKLTRPVLTTSNKEGDISTKQSSVESEIHLPLLTLLPLNALAVDDVNIHFNMEVKSSFSHEKSNEQSQSVGAEASFTQKLNYGLGSTEVSGSVSYSNESKNSETEKYNKSNKATYDVKVHAGQLPLPEGVGVIIKAYTDNISPVIISGDGTKADASGGKNN
ncbi:hypothetical protein C1E24_08990 [Pseudoalteromonas phenolica]|uniref:DUF2589 domain-containing protein n=2 Tax=Pseudoalteromonas phenolica TaxID=161398 RepID=A0A5R9Q4H9_9GAMM|nr:hypothetical protein C1E24_08990 [Pseudoalteromonas phenolica]